MRLAAAMAAMLAAAEVQLGTSVVVSGTLAAHERATVSTKVPGRLQTLSVDLGSRVSKGQVLAQIAPTDYELRVQQAQAAKARRTGSTRSRRAPSARRRPCSRRPARTASARPGSRPRG
jgi:multidrug efflux pump subunit AcrA (membrane-fusion protein)